MDDSLIYEPAAEPVARALLMSGSYLLCKDLTDESTYFSWKTDIKAPVYTNCRNLYGHPGPTAVVAESLWNSINSSFPGVEYIIGVESAGIPWCALVGHRSALPFAYVRKERKPYGADDGLFVGAPPESSQTYSLRRMKAVVIDDLVASGASIENAINAIESERGMKVVGLQSIVNWNFKSMRERFDKLKIRVKALVSYPQILSEALNQGLIEEGIKKELELFYENPKGHTFNFEFLKNRKVKTGTNN